MTPVSPPLLGGAAACPWAWPLPGPRTRLWFALACVWAAWLARCQSAAETLWATEVSRRPEVSAAANADEDAPAAPQNTASEDAAVERAWQVRELVGWQVHVDRRLLDHRSRPLEQALALLTNQLQEVADRLPAAAVAELRKVKLWFSPTYANAPPRAEYHPDAGWLRDHGRDPAMERGVEFTNVEIFAEECRRMPNFALHELAHAYHHQVLGYEHAALLDAFRRAQASGVYDRVARRDAEGRTSWDRAYALTSVQEYFAENTEAYFSRNDFYPFDRAELRTADPGLERLLGRLWGIDPP